MRVATAVLIKTMTNYPPKEPARRTQRKREKERYIFRGDPETEARLRELCPEATKREHATYTPYTFSCMYVGVCTVELRSALWHAIEVKQEFFLELQ